MKYAQNCFKCKGSSSKWGWVGYVLLFPIHILLIYTRTFGLFAWATNIILATIFVVFISKINYEYTDRIPEEILTPFIGLTVFFVIMALKYVFFLIQCPDCKGKGTDENTVSQIFKGKNLSHK